jgi:hypothetical protein
MALRWRPCRGGSSFSPPSHRLSLADHPSSSYCFAPGVEAMHLGCHPILCSSRLPTPFKHRAMSLLVVARCLMKWRGGMSFLGTPSLVSLASQFRLGCCCACSLALLLTAASLALPLAATLLLTCIAAAGCVAAATLIVGCSYFSAAAAPHLRWLWKCSNIATLRCSPLGPVQATTLLLTRCSLKFLNHGQ